MRRTWGSRMHGSSTAGDHARDRREMDQSSRCHGLPARRIGLRSYAQVDPLVAYTNESFDLWNELMTEIQEDIATNIFRVRLVVEEEQHKKSAYKPTATNRSDEVIAKGDRVANAGVGRNDPCPCGSGKKFKKCCGAQKSSAA